MKAATKEFTVGNSKYTPRTATVNCNKGRIWTERKLINNAWLHNGEIHMHSKASEDEISGAFMPEVDHDAVDDYWNSDCVSYSVDEITKMR